MLVVGLALILATVGVVSARRQDRQQGEAGRLFVRVLPVVQTRDAQQVVIASLEADLQRASRELDALRGQVASLAATATAQPPAAMWGKPPRALILDVPAYKQTRSLSCESSAAAMAANFHGIQVSEAEIQAALPRHPDPSLGFRGDVDGPYGGIDDYGVYAEPVRQVLVGLGLEVSHFSEATKVATTVDEIRQHIRQGRVVMAWVTYDMQEQSPVQIWFDDRQPVTLVPYEHVVLVVGYNDDGLWVNDPYTGTTRFYLEAAFARSFAYLGNMGLVVGPPRDG
jgi:uncharacterized protein YvpB